MGVILLIFFGYAALLALPVLVGSLFSSKPSQHGTHYIYYDDDGFDSGDMDGDFSSDGTADSDDDEFYGGIPFGDGKMYLTDDDDFIDEFGDDVL